MKCLTLFAGAGGADIGLANAGVEHVLSVEWNDDAAATSRAAGFPCTTGDVRNLELFDDLEPMDLLWSSFPCQDWSTAGTRQGAKGERNGWPWTVDVLDKVCPRWVLCENVRGLTMHVGDCPTRSGREQADPEACPRCYLDGVIMPQLKERFAWAEWCILDAADYGVPQRRRRVFIAAGPRPIEWPTPTHSGEALAVAKWVTGEHWSCVGADKTGKPSTQETRWLAEHRQQGLFGAPPRFGLKPWCTVRQSLGLAAISPATNFSGGSSRTGEPQSPDHPGIQPVAGGKALGGLYGWDCLTMVMQRGRDGTGAGTSDEHTSSKWKKASHPGLLDMPSPVVSSTEAKGTNGKESTGWTAQGGPCRASDALWLSTGRRRLTVEECATLQDFPLGYPWQGTKTAQYRQVGNAVPPTLARVIAHAVLEADQ